MRNVSLLLLTENNRDRPCANGVNTGCRLFRDELMLHVPGGGGIKNEWIKLSLSINHDVIFACVPASSYACTSACESAYAYADGCLPTCVLAPTSSFRSEIS